MFANSTGNLRTRIGKGADSNCNNQDKSWSKTLYCTTASSLNEHLSYNAKKNKIRARHCQSGSSIDHAQKSKNKRDEMAAWQGPSLFFDTFHFFLLCSNLRPSRSHREHVNLLDVPRQVCRVLFPKNTSHRHHCYLARSAPTE